jgi:hypothetical protein
VVSGNEAINDTKKAKSVVSVAQVANLLFRRLPVGGAVSWLRRMNFPRPRRLAICDTADWQSALQRELVDVGERFASHELRGFGFNFFGTSGIIKTA